MHGWSAQDTHTRVPVPIRDEVDALAVHIQRQLVSTLLCYLAAAVQLYIDGKNRLLSSTAKFDRAIREGNEFFRGVDFDRAARSLARAIQGGCMQFNECADARTLLKYAKDLERHARTHTGKFHTVL